MPKCCNIDTKGRLFRLAIGVVLLFNGVIMFIIGIPGSGLISFGLQFLVAAFGLFAIYEAATGWCLARALGIKTRI
jgi:hypothetical protein